MRIARFALALLVVTGRLFAALPVVAAQASCVHIHEIYYNSPGTDDGSNSSLNAEWIQLHNTCSHSVDMHDWTVRDAASHVYTFGTYSIAATGYVKIHTGTGTNNSTNRYWGKSWYIWNNDADTGTLKDRSANTLDTCSYNNSGASYKLC